MPNTMRRMLQREHIVQRQRWSSSTKTIQRDDKLAFWTNCWKIIKTYFNVKPWSNHQFAWEYLAVTSGQFWCMDANHGTTTRRLEIIWQRLRCGFFTKCLGFHMIVTNEKVARTTRSLVNEMRKRQALFIRHVMRKEIEYFVANREKLPGNEEGVDRKRRCLTVTHHGHTKKNQHKWYRALGTVTDGYTW